MHFWLWQSYGISSCLRCSPLSDVIRKLKMQVKYKDKSFSFVARRDFAVAFEYIVCMILKTPGLLILSLYDFEDADSANSNNSEVFFFQRRVIVH